MSNPIRRRHIQRHRHATYETEPRHSQEIQLEIGLLYSITHDSPSTRTSIFPFPTAKTESLALPVPDEVGCEIQPAPSRIRTPSNRKIPTAIYLPQHPRICPSPDSQPRQVPWPVWTWRVVQHPLADPPHGTRRAPHEPDLPGVPRTKNRSADKKTNIPPQSLSFGAGNMCKDGAVTPSRHAQSRIWVRK